MSEFPVWVGEVVQFVTTGRSVMVMVMMVPVTTASGSTVVVVMVVMMMVVVRRRRLLNLNRSRGRYDLVVGRRVLPENEVGVRI